MKVTKVKPKEKNIQAKIKINPKKYIVKTTDKDEADKNLYFNKRR